jgi:hypothetical protein
MPEHPIRLRGPWDLLEDPGPADRRASNITLPTRFFPEVDSPLILRRRFGRPARLDGQIACRLRAEHIPGLICMSLNGETLSELADDSEGKGELLEVEVGPLLRIRNVLELMVDPRQAASGLSDQPWGSISLVFDDEDQTRG